MRARSRNVQVAQGIVAFPVKHVIPNSLAINAAAQKTRSIQLVRCYNNVATRSRWGTPPVATL